MQTLQALKRKIASAEDLQSVVKTMKAIAAVNIRQYEQAVDALQAYRQTIELGWQIAMLQRPEDVRVEAGSPEGGRRGMVAFGSEQGLCGQFNDTIERYVMRQRERHSAEGPPVLAVIGDRLIARMERNLGPIAQTFRLPSSMSGLRHAVRETLILIERWRQEEGVGSVDLLYNRPRTGAAYDPTTIRAFPIDTQWLHELGNRPWGERSVPRIHMMPWRQLFTTLVRETVAVSLHRAFSESLAAENGSRLASMQAAEQNIDEHLGELQHRFNQQRQRSTTEELLDIISGFEALRREAKTAAD